MKIKVDNYLTHKQIKDLLNVTINPEMKTVLHLMFYAGLRVTEALEVHKHTLKWDLGYPTITLKGKGGKTRTLQIAKPLIPYLKPKPKKINLSRQAVTNHIKRKSKKQEWYEDIGFPISAHTFRHSACHFLIDNNVPINQVQAFMGHSSLQITQYYATTKNANTEHFAKINYD